MACYGYPWPEILNCNKFPADHELCIAAVSTDESSSSRRSKGFFSSYAFPCVMLSARRDEPVPVVTERLGLEGSSRIIKFQPSS